MTIKIDPRSFAKATVGPALGLLAAVAQWVATGHLDQHSLIYFGGGLLGGLVTYLVPNATSEVDALEAADAAFAPSTPDDVTNLAAWLSARQSTQAAPEPTKPAAAPPPPAQPPTEPPATPPAA